jgi:3-oxoacyl-[acyl-carrier-protein] synthase-3
MVVSGECISSLSQNAARSVRTLASKQLASLTVGDAGAAVIVERAGNGARGITSSEFVTFAEYSDLCIGRPCRDGPGAVMYTSPRKLHRAAIGTSSPVVGRALGLAGKRGDELACAIPHQTSVRAIRAGTRLLAGQYGMPKDVVCNLEEFGNTASTTHFVALYRYLEEERLSPGDEILLLVYASGLVVGAMTFTMDELGERYGRPH